VETSKPRDSWLNPYQMVPRLSVVQVQRTSILNQACLKLFENLSLLAGALHFLNKKDLQAHAPLRS